MLLLNANGSSANEKDYLTPHDAPRGARSPMHCRAYNDSVPRWTYEYVYPHHSLIAQKKNFGSKTAAEDVELVAVSVGAGVSLHIRR